MCMLTYVQKEQIEEGVRRVRNVVGQFWDVSV